MKNFVLLLCLLSVSLNYAQEGVTISNNTVTTKEVPPVWPGCEEVDISATNCFQKKLTTHLKKNYKYLRDADGNILRGKAIVSFVIDEEGKPVISKIEGKNKRLNQEAARIILGIPEMTPGHLAGKPIPVKYKVPFTF